LLASGAVSNWRMMFASVSGWSAYICAPLLATRRARIAPDCRSRAACRPTAQETVSGQVRDDPTNSSGVFRFRGRARGVEVEQRVEVGLHLRLRHQRRARVERDALCGIAPHTHVDLPQEHVEVGVHHGQERVLLLVGDRHRRLERGVDHDQALHAAGVRAGLDQRDRSAQAVTHHDGAVRLLLRQHLIERSGAGAERERRPPSGLAVPGQVDQHHVVVGDELAHRGHPLHARPPPSPWTNTTVGPWTELRELERGRASARRSVGGEERRHQRGGGRGGPCFHVGFPP
jgi:hypothetical protein